MTRDDTRAALRTSRDETSRTARRTLAGRARGGHDGSMAFVSIAKRIVVSGIASLVLALPLAADARVDEGDAGNDGEADAREPDLDVVADARAPLATRRAASGACRPAETCCRVCAGGKACGRSCIQASKACRKGRGCACDAAEICDE